MAVLVHLSNSLGRELLSCADRPLQSYQQQEQDDKFSGGIGDTDKICHLLVIKYRAEVYLLQSTVSKVINFFFCKLLFF